MSSFDSDTDESFGEGDSAEPTVQGGKARSSLQVLKSLHGQPFAQAVKLIKYLKANEDKRQVLIKACDQETLVLVAQNEKNIL
jgi:hypothetical protein